MKLHSNVGKLKNFIFEVTCPLIFIAAPLVCSHVAYGNDYPKERISTSFSPGDGKIAFYNYHLNESVDAVYRKGDKYVDEGLDRINHIFRSQSDEKEHAIAIELIELLDHIQDHFKADCLELISGYRSPALNRQLAKKGINVSEESLHMEGKAADIHIDEVTEEAISEYARSLKMGGVGYYPAFDFVHIDVGEMRNWDLPDRPGRLLIALRKGAEWQVTTDKNLYLPHEAIPYEILNITRKPKVLSGTPELEIFRRGEWIPVRKLNYPGGEDLAAGETWSGELKFSKRDSFGKYRIVIPGPKGFEHLEVRSNEFYRKKL